MIDETSARGSVKLADYLQEKMLAAISDTAVLNAAPHIESEKCFRAAIVGAALSILISTIMASEKDKQSNIYKLAIKCLHEAQKQTAHKSQEGE